MKSALFYGCYDQSDGLSFILTTNILFLSMKQRAAYKISALNQKPHPIDSHQLNSMRKDRNKLIKQVIQCKRCKSILHDSSLQEPNLILDKQSTIIKLQSLKNVNLYVGSQRTTVECSCCGLNIGSIIYDQHSIKLIRDNVLCFINSMRPVPDSYTPGEQLSLQKEQSAYSMGMGVVLGEICRHLYMKRLRYLRSFEEINRRLNSYNTIFNNFLIMTSGIRQEESLKVKGVSSTTAFGASSNSYMRDDFRKSREEIGR